MVHSSYSSLSDSIPPVNKILNNNVLYPLFGLMPQKAYWSDRLLPIAHKKCAFVVTLYMVKLLRFCPSTSTFLSS